MTPDEELESRKQPAELFEVTCPHCGDMFDSVPGTEVQCPGCEWRFFFEQLDAESILADEGKI
jgi:DNA-directed RNA polymerase subunit RPC12/RpoP